MRISHLFLCTLLALVASPVRAGMIQGTVYNTSSGTAVPCQAEVILQVQVKGQFVPFRQVASDNQGRFVFAWLPSGEDQVCLVGAVRHGIFYPGPRLHLSELQPTARADLSVCDAVAKPSPLVLKRMDVTIRPEPGLLKVTESLLIENPSHTTYVGEAEQKDGEAVTLALAIPPEFERTTFDKEFFGRRFSIFNNRVVTGIPWTPGEREVKYTYVLRNTQEAAVWQRPLDLPCSEVTVRVEGKAANEVRCEQLRRTQADEKSVVYASAGENLPGGRVLKVELGRLPLPWMTYSKWAAVAILLLLVAVTSWWHFVGRRATPVDRTPRELSKAKRKKRAA
jgi:hypothetical protein